MGKNGEGVGEMNETEMEEKIERARVLAKELSEFILSIAFSKEDALEGLAHFDNDIARLIEAHYGDWVDHHC